jgi:Avirulence protein
VGTHLLREQPINQKEASVAMDGSQDVSAGPGCTKGNLMQQPDSARMEKLAEIHWMLAHAVPAGGDSAARSERALRAIAGATGTELPPFRKGVMPDLEAFVTPLDQFKRRYASLFEDSDTSPRHSR